MKENIDFNTGGIIDNNESPIKLGEFLFKRLQRQLEGKELKQSN